jgi:CRISPR-associated protein Csm3
MLEQIYTLQIKLKLLTGLYIGGTDNGFDIGGADTTVIKNPLTNEPYIPGSSMKGKLKSLLFYRYGKIENKSMTFVDKDIQKIFEPVEADEISMSRCIFRDFNLTEESKELLTSKLGPGTYTEIKAENKIGALSGKAESPRFIERVPAGAEFSGEIVLNAFDGDDVEKMEKFIYESLGLLEYNYLGGSGTRGYGRVKTDHNEFEPVELD